MDIDDYSRVCLFWALLCAWVIILHKRDMDWTFSRDGSDFVVIWMTARFGQQNTQLTIGFLNFTGNNILACIVLIQECIRFMDLERWSCSKSNNMHYWTSCIPNPGAAGSTRHVLSPHEKRPNRVVFCVLSCLLAALWFNQGPKMLIWTGPFSISCERPVTDIFWCNGCHCNRKLVWRQTAWQDIVSRLWAHKK